MSNHVKLNLISDVIKQELEKVLEDVYEEGYYWGKEDAEDNNNSLLELEELREALEDISDIVWRTIHY